MRCLVAVVLCTWALGMADASSHRVRSVGGFPVESDAPYLVSLQSEDGSGGFRQFCTGTVASKFMVLTNAGCAVYAKAFKTRVVLLGTSDADKIREVDYVVMGAGNPRKGEDQIGFLKMTRQVNVADVVRRDALGPQLGQEATLLISQDNATNAALPKITSVSGTIVACDAGVDTTTKFCVASNGVSLCQSDAGSPIMDSSGKQLGVAFEGLGCNAALTNKQVVYTRLANVTDRIVEVLSDPENLRGPTSSPTTAPTKGTNPIVPIALGATGGCLFLFLAIWIAGYALARRRARKNAASSSEDPQGASAVVSPRSPGPPSQAESSQVDV